MSATNDILKHLQERYNFEPVQPSHLISGFGCSIPLQGRDELISATQQLYNARWENRSTRDRVAHRIGVIGGCNGVGKSRALIKIAESMKDWIKKDQWSFEIVISYNNGNPPIIDRFISSNAVKSASVGFALRLLYFSFVAGKSFEVSFEKFVRLYPKEILDVLTPELAIEAISLHLSVLNGHNDGVIFIGLDEVNYLLDSGYAGEEDKRGFLKDTLIALGSAMLIPDRFVFVVIAATTILPINIVFHQSGLQIQPLPINLLNGEQCETIVSIMTSTSLLSEGWADWRTCRAFRTLLADFGSMPRRAEELLTLVKQEVERGSALADIDYQTICCNLVGTTTAQFTILEKLAECIVSNILLATNVQRHQIVDVKKSPFTYGELEAIGAIALATSRDTHLTVQMPYSLFRVLVQLMDGGDPLTKSLRRICNLVQREDEFSVLSWQSFEDLHCNMEAIREMLIARSDLERPCSSLQEFYCITDENELNVNFDFVLRRNCPVITADKRYPASLSDLVDDPNRVDVDGNQMNVMTSYVKNAPGAAFDSFTVRQLDEGEGTMLFCGQQKRYIETAVSAGMISREANKVSTSLPEGTSYVLVVVATKVTSDALVDLPENCVVVTGPALERFYSVFSARVNLLSNKSLSQINVNTASSSELMTIEKIGRAIARTITKNRKENGCFTSWDNLNLRIPRTRKFNEDDFSY